MKNVTYINASAGSGKTYTLTHRLADLIKSGAVKPEQVIMTTFTVKAANEMREEAKRVLYEQGLFAEANRLDQAMIGTIHSVANALVKKYWFFLGLSPDMGVMSEEDSTFYVSQSLSDLPTPDELKQLNEYCANIGIEHSYFFTGKSGLNYDYWKEDLVKVIGYTINYEIFNYERSIKESLDFLHQFVTSDKVKVDYSEAELVAVLDEYETFAQTQRASKTKNDVLDDLKALRRGVKNPSIVWFKKLLKTLGAWKRGCPPKAAAISEDLSDMWHSQYIYDLQEKYIRLLFLLAERWNERFATYKKEKNLLDYNDMERYLRNLLEKDVLVSEISQEYRYLFVDEYQDCSPIQVKIFDRLSEMMEHSYWVGDYKQAIYGFRGSDVTLTKTVVDTIGGKLNGCDTDTLETSYRSLPDIVKVCNETFGRTFAGVLDKKNIELKQHRKNSEKIKSLRYWEEKEVNGMTLTLADHVAYLVSQGVKPSDIAVLCRKNTTLAEIADKLQTTYSIPVSRGNIPVGDLKITQLLVALLSLIVSEKDALAKAQIAFLTEKDYDTKKIIEEKLLFDASEENGGFLGDVELIGRALNLRSTIKQQSIATLIETVIVELDLYNIAKRMGRVAESMSCLDTIIGLGRTYEQHCMQMNLPATIVGFIDYLEATNPVCVGDVNGVQLHTYHSSKGLQWKYVVLDELSDSKKNKKKCVKQNIYGIHFYYTEQPSVENPYPEVYIQVAPFVYGVGNTNAPDDIQAQIEGGELFEKVSRDALAEENRLLYVGMTRPRDVLILSLKNVSPKSLQWFVDMGLDCVHSATAPDILGVGCKFVNDSLTSQQCDIIQGYSYLNENEKMMKMVVPYCGELCNAEPKYLAPSVIDKTGDVKHWSMIGKRIPVGSLDSKTMADVGNCIHQIFCAIEQNHDDEAYFSNLIKCYGLSKGLRDYGAIRCAWDNLVEWLQSEFGAAVRVYHERPFVMQKDGCVYTGSIDLVWKTDKGCVVVDFKTCPLGEEYVLNPDSEHYVGRYSGQLDAYTTALEAASERVLHRYIYYPVTGMICEI